MPGEAEIGGEAEFLSSYDPRAFEPIAVTVDVALLTIRQGLLCVLLVRRGGHPFKGSWALPGGFVGRSEDLDEAALRELGEEAGVAARPWHLEQLKTYGSPTRDPRMRVVSVAYLGLMPDLPRPFAGTDADEARFWPIADLVGDDAPQLAFDHDVIVVDAVERARAKLEYTSLATAFVEEPFTISDLRRVYEAVWSVELHPANFRRKVLSAAGLVIPTGEDRPTGRGRAELYRRGTITQLHPPMLRPGDDASPALSRLNERLDA